ncbi:hypothetical protein FIU86_03595 [Roseovarius sp. THAF9]|uniref:hypothetical protein n=1 Tax=Roseovarius sp. THAF9 TaxID=2587847 RepID=UPI001268AF79|nr:hypothetical protein [Roseovarius sp. THAF9]QFT91912.1 hypothetical protein FIU86_03595 [Roseovarius sp. THAF9]
MATLYNLIEVTSISAGTTYSEENGNLLGVVDGASGSSITRSAPRRWREICMCAQSASRPWRWGGACPRRAQSVALAMLGASRNAAKGDGPARLFA